MTDITSPRRYGLAGIAGRQAPYLLGAYTSLRRHGFQVVAGCDPQIDVARGRAQQFGIPEVYATLQDMIAGAGLHGLIVATPHRTHRDLAIEAMERGLDVFCEKPMADTLVAAMAMVRAAERCGATLGVNYLYSGWSPWLARQLATGVIGDVRGATVRWSRADGIPESPEFWGDADAGVLRDLVGHEVSTLSPVVPGAPVRVRAWGSRAAGAERHGDAFAAWDTVSAEIEMSSGALVKIYASWADGGPAEEEIALTAYGQHGAMEVQYPGPRTDVEALRAVVRVNGHEARFGPEPDLYATVAGRHALDWHRAATGPGPEPAFSAQQALLVERVVHAIGEATRARGAWVPVPGVGGAAA